jgi:hypothetical protein
MTGNSRINVSPPRKEKLEYGLLSVVEDRSAADTRWQNGVTWQNVCPDSNSTYEACLLGNALGVPVTGITTAPAKEATAARSTWGATPFTVKAQIDCSPPGFYADADEFVRRAFDEAEEVSVAEVFFSGTVAGTANLQYPHLAATAQVDDDIPGGSTFQLSAANLGPSGGASLDVVEALGRLEQALGACVHGKGVIHVSAELVAHMKAQHLLEESNGVYYTVSGHKIAASPGYSGASPDGVVQVGVSWMYGTGPVFLYKSRPKFIGTEAQSLDRTVNTLQRLYERHYVIGYDCCLFAVPVSTGGVAAGAINAAT